MALNPRKLQKKVERRKAKHHRRSEVSRRKVETLAERIERLSAAPILHCCTNPASISSGMTLMLISRQLPSGSVVFAEFVVDLYCLGVKNARSGVLPFGEYRESVYERRDSEFHHRVDPEYARKLVEGAVEYARQLGFAPCKEYEQARQIFGDIDAGACAEAIEYGLDGKPFYIAGPHDSAGRSRQIVETLREAKGDDDFDFLIPMAEMPGTVGSHVDFAEAGEFDDDDEDDESDGLDELDLDDEGAINVESRPIDGEGR